MIKKQQVTEYSTHQRFRPSSNLQRQQLVSNNKKEARLRQMACLRISETGNRVCVFDFPVRDEGKIWFPRIPVAVLSRCCWDKWSNILSTFEVNFQRSKKNLVPKHIRLAIKVRSNVHVDSTGMLIFKIINCRIPPQISPSPPFSPGGRWSIFKSRFCVLRGGGDKNSSGGVGLLI